MTDTKLSADCQMKDGTLHSVLRRMVVSPYHRRMGIATSLVGHLIAHARKNRLPSISLRTTQFQAPARRLYEKFGWVEQERKWMGPGIFGVWVFWYWLDLTDTQDARRKTQDLPGG